ncbi:MAG: hypothetical protein CVU11_08510 [Bacteroidetes bacterium HGW-Bacteroidetes-6]|jgi:hypothetical protein|nr:MAG: hypothetical protein CVU11_08510 [Bacteroidetes bacterium HGW-Bacteroidetes-6]
MMKRRKNLKYVAAFTALLILNEAFYPMAAMALTSGPSSPEFSSFEPVATTSMVNEFSGDFTYNIPVLNIPGANGGEYAMSLSYHSGENVESEASWVGYGWTLNPGSIVRNKRGFADDINNGNVTYYNKMPANWTGTIGFHFGNPEAFSMDVPVQLSASIRYNNYRGFGYSVGAGVSVAKGLVSLGFSVNDGQMTFSPKLNVGKIMKIAKKKKEGDDEKTEEVTNSSDEEVKKKNDCTAIKNSRSDYKKNRENGKGNKMNTGSAVNKFSKSFSSTFYAGTNFPSVFKHYSGTSVNLTFSLELVPTPVPVGPEIGAFGSYTRQVNEPVLVKSYNGYMYSSLADNNPSSIMDYYTENDQAFTDRELYTGVPFSNADQYNLTGEGLSGGFRIIQNRIGHFRPNEEASSTTILQLGVETQVGLNFGLGGDIGVGWQSLKIKGDWPNSGNTNDYLFAGSGSENQFFRFNNDLGGDVDYSWSTDAQAAKMKSHCSIPGAKSYSPQVSTANSYLTSKFGHENVNRSGRSSYIGYNTFNRVGETVSSVHYRAYDKRNAGVSFENENDDQIREFAISKDDGMQYVYGIPVNGANEVSLQYGLNGCQPTVTNHKYAYTDCSDFKMKVGEENDDTYATTYLLTQITTPDYLDVNNNGPDESDFGGYVMFNYTRLYGGSNIGDWYKWRMPYNGLSFSDNQLSDLSDNTGSVSYGYKEIYYLESIETKTHIAKFITENRFDGKDAEHDEAAARNESDAKGSKSLKSLKRIELYAKDGQNLILVQTINFEYDYSLCALTPNSDAPMTNGKLTLKKVWFEYNGVVNAKTSPYIFNYNYPETDYPSPYDSFEDYGQGLNENPAYSANCMDRWGYYEANGEDRNDSLNPWVDQTPPTNFDPAAWQLKCITLPSGGQIHVQYEQDEYLYVQDRRADVMVSLSDHSENNREFRLNVEKDLGVTSSSDIDSLVKLINQEYAEKKIYFKFLYSMVGNNADFTLNNIANTEFIDGYVSIERAEKRGTAELWIVLKSGEDQLPVKVCRDFVRHEKGNKLNDGNASYTEVTDENDEGQVKSNLLNIATGWGSSKDLFEGSCKEMNNSMSYFRIPTLKPKKGGGLRVKRIMMYDPGMERGDHVLFGTEYLYINNDGTCSGVASNEPAEGRDENVLIDLLVSRENQTWIQKAIAGKDKSQFEGPIGQSVLPGPLVGYSRVVSRNIHSGSSSPGFVVNEFYTWKDFPFDYSFNTEDVKGKAFDNTSIEKKTDRLNMITGILNYIVANVWATQGFRFVQYNISGSPKAITTYAGSYNNPNEWIETSRQKYEYYLPGESIPMFYGIGDIRNEFPGKETEIVMEKRHISDITNDLNVEFDANVGLLLIPLPFASAMPSYTYSESKISTHATTKLISYPVIQKKITASQDGITQTTENLAFDIYSGKPIVTKTYDGFSGMNLQQSSSHDGYYVNYAIPASYYYSALRPKALSERKLVASASGYTMNIQLSGNYIDITSSGGCVCEGMKGFSEGDLLKLNYSVGGSAFCHITQLGTSGFYIAGAFGSTINSSGTLSSIEVIRSGRTNQLGSPAASVTTYGTPLMTGSALSQQEIAARLAFVATLESHKLDASYQFQSDLIAAQFKEGISCDSTAEIDMAFDNGILTVNVDDNCETVLSGSGSFVLDQNSGKVYWEEGSCRQDIPCFVFCNSEFDLQKVVSANATAYSDNWLYDPSDYNIETVSGNNYEKGCKGKWRPKYSYVYKEGIVGGAKPTERNYKDAGVFGFRLFDFAMIENNDVEKWIRTSEITRYTPDGNPVEEKNILGIYSCAKMGYINTLVYMMAQNAKYGQAQFESFENVYTIASQGMFEDRNISNSIANQTDAASHSGRNSYLLSSSGSEFIFKPINKEGSLDEGVSVKVWVKDDTYANSPVKLKMAYSTSSSDFAFTRIARIGEWALYQAVVPEAMLSASYSMTFSIVSNVSSTIYIDDARLQPTNAQVSCYVYDVATKKLLASFDDQHFGLFYQYNAEGKLIRKKVETVNGIKTIQETHYHTPSFMDRNDD